MLSRPTQLLALFRPGNRAEVFIWQNFQPTNRDFGNRASPPFHMNTSKILQRILRWGEISETGSSRSTGVIRVTPVNRGHPGHPGHPGSCEEALNLLLFLPFSLPSPSSDLKLPTELPSNMIKHTFVIRFVYKPCHCPRQHVWRSLLYRVSRWGPISTPTSPPPPMSMRFLSASLPMTLPSAVEETPLNPKICKSRCGSQICIEVARHHQCVYSWVSDSLFH